MDYETIAFEKVSISEAKAALKGIEAPAKEEKKWDTDRKAPLPADLKLLNETCLWLVNLPEHIRPLQLARKFPRIANKIASVWDRSVMCDKYLDSLMIDHRGTRQGFPLQIAIEITELRAYFNTEINKSKPDTWTLTL